MGENINKHKKQLDDKTTVAILELYWKDWHVRTDRLWKSMIQFFIVDFFMITLPYSIDVISDISLPNMPLIFFPCLGILGSFVYLWICIAESSRLDAISRKVRTLLKLISPQYQLATLQPIISGKKNNSKVSVLLKVKMSVWIPVLFTIILNITAIVMILQVLGVFGEAAKI